MSAPAVERPTTAAADQQRTIYVLAQIATRGLPVIGWNLSGVALDKLEGHAVGDTDAEKRVIVGEYADALDATVVERRRSDHTRLTVTATYSGVQVTVYALVAKHAEMRAGQIWEDSQGARWRVVGVPRPGDQTRLYFVPEAATDTRTTHVIDGVRGKFGPLALVEQTVAVSGG